MALKSKHRVDPSFNSAGMQDVVFLLLIFFILTSNNIIKDTVPVNEPKSSVHRKTMPDLIVKISKSESGKADYFVNDKKMPFNDVEGELKRYFDKFKDPTKVPVVVISADGEITLNEAFDLQNIVSKLGGKPSFSVKKLSPSNPPIHQ